jgi:hypothetical protein
MRALLLVCCLSADFDRTTVVPDMNGKIAGFFQRHLKAH